MVSLSGIAGRFPESDSLDEFGDHLYKAVDMVTDCRRGWNTETYNIPGRMGQLNNLDKFDSEFFSVHSKQTENMDPRLRFLLEVSYECITDAGLNTLELSGSNVGVYVGASGEEAGAFFKDSTETPSGYGLTGALVSTFANRLSFTHNFRGPSITMDTACSSSLLALQQALFAIRFGLCDSALVAGVHLCLDPKTTLEFTNLSMTTPDGKCKSFDSAADGYVRSEAAVAVYLCKQDAARRCYAEVIHANTNTDGYKANGFTYPSGEIQETLLRKVYDEARVSPKDVVYIEAHGTGTQAGDSEEINAISRVFCSDRSRDCPLLLGSVKSNMGHSEPASGLCGIAKLVLVAQTRIIPGNLHFLTPNPKIPALLDGRIRVVSSNTPLEGGLVGISSFGFGGSNVHAILKIPSHDVTSFPTSNIPVIMPLSGRTAEVAASLEKLAGTEGNQMVAALLQNIARYDIPGHGFRSYALIDKNDTAAFRMKSSQERIQQRGPLWFIFSGTGTQYIGMVKDMMRMETFNKSIQNSSKMLKGRNFDLDTLLISKDEKILNDELNCCVSIVALQVALVDLLKASGLNPDMMVGHSLGEIAAAYADECLTVEQTLHLALVRGQGCKLALPGAMASIGISWEEALKRVPSDVFLACDNSAENVTISGNMELVDKFVADLQGTDIFARKIESSSMAFHSTHMNPCAEYMNRHLPSIIPDPKSRSSKWISTSVPKTESPTIGSGGLASVNYFVNNVLAPVRFREVAGLIPANAVAIEIAPHCVLQAILKRALPPTVVNIGVMSKKAARNSDFFLQALGEIYLAGYNPNFEVLYNWVKFPLGPSTPMISPVIRWDHSQSWLVPIKKESLANGAKIQVCPKNEKDSFYLDHIIDGRILFPGTGYMYLAWTAFAKKLGKLPKNCPVTFENVRFERGTVLSADGTTEFNVNIQPESGDFEVFEGESAACRGRIQEMSTSYSGKPIDWTEITELAESSSPCKDEFYKAFRLRGYGHSGSFRGIEKADHAGSWAEFRWSHNWVAFLDCFLQLQVLHKRGQGMFVPIRVQKAVLNPQVLFAYLADTGTQKVPIKSLEYNQTIYAPGIEFSDIKAGLAPRRGYTEEPQLAAYKFLPFTNEGEERADFEKDLTFCLEIAMDNTLGNHFTILEIAAQKIDFVSPTLKGKLAPKFSKFDIFIMSENPQETDAHVEVLSKADLTKQMEGLVSNLIIFSSHEKLLVVEEFMNPQCFLLCIETHSTELTRDLPSYQIVAQRAGVILYRRQQTISEATFNAIEVNEDNYDWVEKVRNKLQSMEGNSRLYLHSKSTISGLQGLVQCLRKEGYSQLRSFEILDGGSSFDFDNPTQELKEIVGLDLAYNVYRSGSWGCFTKTTLKDTVASNSSGSSSFAYTMQPGDLSSITWIQSPSLDFADPVKEGLLICEVSYAALNFRDIMLATGKLSRDALPVDCVSDERILGLEYSGVLKNGTRVFGLQEKCLATTVEIRPDDLMLPVPKDWTLTEAATITVAYATAYYALVVKGNLLDAETVLIHAGAGGVGQAAIAVAVSRNCRVLTTVSTKEKREFLKSRFPQLTDDSFADSRDPVAFEDHVKKVTNGRGVEVVLNSLSGESLRASIRCLGKSGRFLEIGKFDLFNNSEIGMEIFLRSIEFHGVLLDYLCSSPIPPYAIRERRRVKELLKEGIVSGEVKPLPYAVYGHDQLEDAFRFMASGKHIGKLLIKIRDDPYALANIPVVPRTYFYPHKVYILVGGLGGMGLEIADWMVARGSRKIVFVSRKGVRSWYQEHRIKEWQLKGASITISTNDVTSAEGVLSLMKEARDLGPIGGLFNLAVELRDSLFVNQTGKDFEVVSKPKVVATRLLDRLSRNCKSLDLFVVFSSATVLAGNSGQSNYGFANSAIERICMQRRAVGLHGLAIQWGPIGDVGIYHLVTGGREVPIAGMEPQPIPSVLRSLDVFLNTSEAVVSSFIVESSDSEKRDALGGTSLVEIVARILGIRKISNVNPGETFTELGMDSLMGTEIKQLLERKLNTSIASTTIMSMTFGKLEDMEKDEVNRNEGSEQVMDFGHVPLVMPKSTLVVMESKRTRASNLFLVHAVEGNLLMLEGLVKKIDCAVYGFECAPDAPLSSIPDLASHYIASMQTVQADGPFKLAGYSYGGAVACEMAIQLEGKGETVELLLLDSSHLFPRIFSQMYSQNFKLQEVDTLWLLFFLLKHSAQNLEKVESEMQAIATWEAKLDLIAGKLIHIYPALTLQEIKFLGTRFVQRLSAGCSYSPETRIKCNTVLVRAGKTGYDPSVGEDYGLSVICASPVKIIAVDGHHTCFYQKSSELKIPQIINDLL